MSRNVEIHFLLMPDMDRPAHRWDSCCRRWLVERLPMLWYWLIGGQWSVLRVLTPRILAPIVTGKCPWHGKREITDAEFEQMVLRGQVVP